MIFKICLDLVILGQNIQVVSIFFQCVTSNYQNINTEIKSFKNNSLCRLDFLHMLIFPACWVFWGTPAALNSLMSLLDPHCPTASQLTFIRPVDLELHSPRIPFRGLLHQDHWGYASFQWLLQQEYPGTKAIHKAKDPQKKAVNNGQSNMISSEHSYLTTASYPNTTEVSAGMWP